MKTLASNHASNTADLLAKVADEFLKAKDQGLEPDVEAYAERYPEIGPILRDIPPALTLMNPSLSRGDSPPPDAENLSSRTLGDFRIEREIGRGGMGVVYQAEQISLRRTVALKVLPFAAMLDPRQLTRFRNEARAAAALHHTNIVPVFSVGCERGVHFYAMQYIEGESLASLIANLRRPEGQPTPVSRGTCAVEPGAESVPLTLRREDAASRRSVMPTLEDGVESPSAAPPTTDWTPQGKNGAAADLSAESRSGVSPLSPTRRDAASTTPEAQALLSTARSTSGRAYFRTAAELGIQAAEALDYAHEQGVIHRDIKPANLILDETGRLWITDFGLARMESDAGMTMTGDLVGTLRYMSPEQALAKRVVVDHRTDIYSLGVTLYELLTLRSVFDGEDRQHLLKQMAFEEPVALRKVNRQIPFELETIVLKAIRKNPEERYATARDLAEDLRSFLGNKPIKAKPPGRRERLAKWSRRHPALLFSAAIIATVVALGSSVASVLINGAKNDAILSREKALNAEAQAKTSGHQANAALEFLTSILRSPDPERDGHTITVSEVLDRSAKELQDRFTDDPLTKAMLMRHIGMSYWGGLELYREAIPLLEQSRDLYVGALGREDPDTLAVTSQLSGAYASAGRTDEAVRLLEETIRIEKAKLGAEPPDLIFQMNNLGFTYRVAGRIDDALRFGEETFKLEKAKLGPENPVTLATMHHLAFIYRVAGRIDDAVRLDEETFKFRKATLGPDYYETLWTMHDLAEAYVRANRLGEAESIARECLEIREKKRPDDWPTFDTRSLLGNVLLSQKKYAEAEPLLVAGYEGMHDRVARIPAYDKPRLHDALQRLVQLYEATNRPEKADAWKAKLAEFDKDAPKANPAVPKQDIPPTKKTEPVTEPKPASPVTNKSGK